MFRQAITRLPCSVPLKVFKGLLHDRKGDANLQGFAVTDPLDFQIPERLVFISGWMRNSGESGR